MKLTSAFLAAAVAVGLASSAHADTVLLNLIDPAVGSANFDLSFTATSTSVTLTDGGYQVPGFTHFINNDVTTGGGPNLLGQTWVFTAAPSGSDTSQFNDGTSVNGLNFGGVTVGSYGIARPSRSLRARPISTRSMFLLSTVTRTVSLYRFPMPPSPAQCPSRRRGRCCSSASLVSASWPIVGSQTQH
jgi:hypothetical protein